MTEETAEVVSMRLLTAHLFSLITQLYNAMNCEHLLLIYYSLFIKSEIFCTCIKNFSKSVFFKTERPILFNIQ